MNDSSILRHLKFNKARATTRITTITQTEWRAKKKCGQLLLPNIKKKNAMFKSMVVAFGVFLWSFSNEFTPHEWSLSWLKSLANTRTLHILFACIARCHSPLSRWKELEALHLAFATRLNSVYRPFFSLLSRLRNAHTIQMINVHRGKNYYQTDFIDPKTNYYFIWLSKFARFFSGFRRAFTHTSLCHRF